MVSQKMLLERPKPRAFYLQNTIGVNNCFTLLKINFQVFKMAKFEFKLTVHYGL